MDRIEIALRLMEARPQLLPFQALNLADELLPQTGKILNNRGFMYRFQDPTTHRAVNVYGDSDSIDALMTIIEDLSSAKKAAGTK